MPVLQKWRNHGVNDGKLLTAEQKMLRENYEKIFQFSNHPEISGSFYDLMWQNQDLPSHVRSKVYAFLRYVHNSILLIVVCFDTDISETRIRIPSHALELAGMSEKDRFNLQELHPHNASSNLMLTQLTSTGVPISFDHTGWTAIRLI